jgi:hypothetical protein
VHFDVNVSNPGVSPFDVENVHIKVVESEPAKVGTDWGKGFVNIGKLEQGKQVFEENLNKAERAPLLGHYSPQSSYHETFSWRVAKPMPLVYLFRVDVDVKGKITELSNAGEWNEGLCLENEEQAQPLQKTKHKG